MIIGEPVHYVRNSSGDPYYPRLCRAALITGLPYPDTASLVVFDPSGVRFYSGCRLDDSPEPAGGSWHPLENCHG